MAKTLAQEEFEIKHANEVELAKRELTRRALDTIRVYNPLDHTFSFMYDRYWHRIPAKSYKDLDRYLAVHFFKKICDFMIGQQIMVQGDELKKVREKQMGHQFLDHYEENVEVWDKTPKLDDPDLIDQIKKVVLIGVVEEYGMDEPEPEDRVPEAALDYRPLHEQIFATIDNKIAPDEPTAPQEPIVVAPAIEDEPEVPRVVKPLEDVPNPKLQPKESLEKEATLNEQDKA